MSFDRLTHVLDREFFEYLLDLEVHKAVRYLYFFSLLVVQTNGPKQEMDQDGSSIITIARLIRDEIRGTDVVGRIDVNRLFIILHQADFQQARGIGERVMTRIRNYSFVIDGQEIKKTISIGGACFPTHANDMNGLITKSEDMLSQSKNEGGTRVRLPA